MSKKEVEVPITQINLEDFIPEPGEFTVGAMGGKTIHLRPVSLEDELWIQKNLGDVDAAFKKGKVRDIARIVFRLMVDEDRELFKTREVIVVGENGEETKESVGGIDLLCRVVRGTEKISMMNAVLKIIGASRAMAAAEDRAKGKFGEAEKKSSEPSSTGETSLTPLLQNTDGQ